MTNSLAVIPIVIIGVAEQDSDVEIDVDEVRGDQFAVDDDAGRDVHGPAPVGHGLVIVIANIRVLERTPAAEQDAAPPPDLLVAGQRLVEKVEEIVVQRDAFLHELAVAHQPA